MNLKNITAEILPLEGKYYGTDIRILENHQPIGSFEIWVNGLNGEGYLPSVRESIPPNEIWDDHFESNLSYSLAKCFVEAVNSAS
jgi:hypothetical protein